MKIKFKLKGSCVAVRESITLSYGLGNTTIELLEEVSKAKGDNLKTKSNEF